MNRFTQFVPGDGLILDPTCGPAEWWNQFPNARVVKCDFRNPQATNVLCDARMLPFADNTFDEIWCDPPHLIRNDIKHWNPTYLRYGYWPYRYMWERFLNDVNFEFMRVAKPSCRLIMKIIDGKDRRVTKRSDLNRLTLWRVVDEETWKSGAAWSTCTSHMVAFELRK